MSVPPDPSADPDLDRLLARMPVPDMPADLAARIVRDVTRLPQMAPEPVAIVPIARRRPRWLLWTGGGAATALAASLAALLLVPESAQPPAPAPTPAVTPDLPAPVMATVDPAPAKPTASRPNSDAVKTASAPPPPIQEATPAAPVAAPSSPPVETADSADDDSSETLAAGVADDTALPAADIAPSGLAAGGTGGVPAINGTAPNAEGWGYAPGTRYPRSPAPRPEEGDRRHSDKRF